MDDYRIKEATELSYWRIVRALEEHPHVKFTINISGCLVSRWENLGYFDLIERIKNLIEKKQIELVGSAAYHPILPLISEGEAKRQIAENEEIIRKYFGTIKLKGFFFPEMAYNHKVAKIIKSMGYKYLILDEISRNGKLNQTDTKKIYLDKNSGLKIVFRERGLSKKYVPDELLGRKNKNEFFITATDGELYGLRHMDPTGEFEKLLKNKNLITKTISEFIAEKKSAEKISVINSNWESTEEEIKKRNYYALWQNKKNKIHNELWKLASIANKLGEKNKKDKNYYWVRWHLVRGLASCTFWWASGKDLGEFSPLPWNPDEIERGTNELIRSIRALDNQKTRKEKIKAEKIYIKIKQLVWKHHWTYYWKKK